MLPIQVALEPLIVLLSFPTPTTGRVAMSLSEVFVVKEKGVRVALSGGRRTTCTLESTAAPMEVRIFRVFPFTVGGADPLALTFVGLIPRPALPLFVQVCC